MANSKDILSKTALFFGSFNPIHTGHLIIAQFFSEYTDINQVWFVVTPHNPLKAKATLAADHHRLNMVKAAIEDSPKFRACDIEFGLPQPSYTIKTLTYLKEKYPAKEFVLLMGGDNLLNLHKWKNYEQIVTDYDIYVYKRQKESENRYANNKRIHYFDVPLLDISSSFIRDAVKNGKDMGHFVPVSVMKYIREMFLYV